MNCKACKTEIDSKATKCPHCQSDQRNWGQRHPIITAIVWILFVLVVIGIFTTPKNEITRDNKQKQETVQAQPTTTTQLEQDIQVKTDIPAEYKSALNKANTYSSIMHMSKRGVYDQLVSGHGEKFSPEAAQYAIDNMQADWNANALEKAKTYQDTMSMSPASIHDQLTSEHGEKFTQSEADYAIQHLND